MLLKRGVAPFHFQEAMIGASAVAQWDWHHLCSTRTQVRSSAWHSGLKDPALSQLQRRSQLSLGSDPWPGNPWSSQKRKKRKEKKLKLRVILKSMNSKQHIKTYILVFFHLLKDEMHYFEANKRGKEACIYLAYPVQTLFGGNHSSL